MPKKRNWYLYAFVRGNSKRADLETVVGQRPNIQSNDYYCYTKMCENRAEALFALTKRAYELASHRKEVIGFLREIKEKKQLTYLGISLMLDFEYVYE